jgi:diguanylate cyclase (GGDEF)-like protein
VTASTDPSASSESRRSTRRLLVVVALALGIAAVPAFAERRLDAGAWPFLLLGAITLFAAVSMAVAAHRGAGRLRWAWGLLATATAVTAYLHAALAWSTEPPGGVLLRLTATVLAGSAIVAFPGTVRSPARWLFLGLDGWLLGGSLFIGLWLFSVTPARLEAAPDGLLMGSGWVLTDLAIASVVFALTRRLPTYARAGGIALSISAALMSNGDLYRAFFSTSGWGANGRAAYLGSWTAAVVIAGATPWIVRSPFAAVVDDDSQRRAIRVPYAAACLAIAAAVAAWTLGRPPDPMLAFVVVTLLASILSSQTLLGVENARLVAQVSEQAETFRERATRDQLTGLPNRGEFTGRVEAALRTPARGRVAVLFLDLDGFKDVNDSFGHAVGDDLLVEAAARLSADVRERDVVARFGGDEFVALLTDCSDEVAADVAERLRESLSRPYRVAGREVVVSASIGLARPTAADDAESALRNADLALYRAKSGGRDRVAVYEPEMHASVLRRLDGAARLRRALADDRLAVAYQPIVDLRTGAVYGVETLLRFDGADLPGWSVAEAVAAAEESGLIVPIGRWVLDAAVAQLGEWTRAGRTMRVAVNVSARQLETGTLAAEIEAALQHYAVPPELLCLEITEHQLVRSLEDSTRELGRLRQLGVRIALDDFGTGYSSLSYLPRLPLDGLKVDRELVMRVGGARDTVPAVLRLGRDLGLTVVAEGIETVDQLVLLRAAGCTLGQGYLLSRPLDAPSATALLELGRVALPADAMPGGRVFVSDDETGRVTA